MRYSTIIIALAGLAAAVVTPNNAGAKNVGLGNGAQFITGGCVSNADCSSACCANNSQGLGVCSAEAAALQNDKQGCGFSDPNSAATIAAAKAQVEKQGFKREAVPEVEEDEDDEEDDE